jgi:hypothetical protein
MTITFLLAFVGYATLAAAAVTAVVRPRRGLIRVCAAIVLAHVVLVWRLRYDWQLAEATRNGPAGFVVFHTALAAILWATVAPDAWARRLIIAGFAIVTMGALGAVFRYDDVRSYRVPVIVCAVAGAAGIAGRAARRRPGAVPRTEVSR